MPSPKIAVVDDEDLIRSVLCDLIRAAVPSAEIVEYASAKYALHEIEAGTVDLLITNCHMADMDGPTLVRKVREEKHSVPIIMVSGSEDARRLGEEAGIDRFVAKSLMHSELARAIAALIEVPPRVAAQ